MDETETSNIVALRQPDEIDDPLTNILRAGARQLLAQAVEIEVETFLATMKDLKLANGRARVVRHGYGPARTIATGIGPVEVARASSRRWRADPVQLDDPAAVGAAHQEPGCALAGALPKDDAATDRSRELRLLELYLKYHTAFTNSRLVAAASWTERPDVRYSRAIRSSGARRVGRAVRIPQRIHVMRSAVVIGMAGVGIFTIILIAANL
jgi:hypothetical protein